MDVDQQQQEDGANKAAAPPAAAAAVAAVTSGDDDEDADGEVDEEQLEEYQEMLASIGAHPVSFGACFTGFCLGGTSLGNLSKFVCACYVLVCAPHIIMLACLLIREPTSPVSLAFFILFRTN